MTTYGLMFDNEYCTGCHSCELACRNHLDLPLGQWGIKLLEMGPWRKLDGRWEGKYVPVPTTYCDLCADRVERGLVPSCVQTCQAKVLYYGTIEECAKKLAEKGKKAAIFIP